MRWEDIKKLVFGLDAAGLSFGIVPILACFLAETLIHVLDPMLSHQADQRLHLSLSLYSLSLSLSLSPSSLSRSLAPTPAFARLLFPISSKRVQRRCLP